MRVQGKTVGLVPFRWKGCRGDSHENANEVADDSEVLQYFTFRDASDNCYYFFSVNT